MIGRLARDGTAIAADGSEHTLFPLAVPVAEGRRLSDWVVREGAAHTIEIGLGYGMSALFACTGLVSNGDSTAKHVVIDPFQRTRFANCGLQFLEEAGLLHMVEHHAEESQVVLPRLLSDGRTFDLAFVDGNHRFDRVFLDLIYLGRLLGPGRIVFVDDYQLAGIAKAVSFCITNLGWTREEVSAADPLHQWAVLRTALLPDTRAFDDYVDF